MFIVPNGSGIEYEKSVFSYFYKKFGLDCYIEPNIEFLEKATPSVITIEAEIDILVYSENLSHIVECKAAPLELSHIEDFQGKVKENIKTKNVELSIFTNQDYDNQMNTIARDLGINLQKIDVKDMALVDDEDITLVDDAKRLFRYYKYARNNLPGLTYCLNDIWRLPSSQAKRRINIVLQTLKESLTKFPKNKRSQRIIAEFVYLKSLILQSIVMKDQKIFTSCDLTNTIRGEESALKTCAEKILGESLKIHKGFSYPNNKREFVHPLIEKDDNTQYVVLVGNDDNEKYHIIKILKRLGDRTSKKRLRVISTETDVSKKIVKELKTNLERFYLIDKGDFVLDLSETLNSEKKHDDIQIFLGDLFKNINAEESSFFCGFPPKDIVIELFSQKVWNWDKFYMFERPCVSHTEIKIIEKKKIAKDVLPDIRAYELKEERI